MSSFKTLLEVLSFQTSIFCLSSNTNPRCQVWCASVRCQGWCASQPPKPMSDAVTLNHDSQSLANSHTQWRWSSSNQMLKFSKQLQLSPYPDPNHSLHEYFSFQFPNPTLVSALIPKKSIPTKRKCLKSPNPG